MAKYNKHFYEVSAGAHKALMECQNLTVYDRWLYIVLCRVENKLTNRTRNSFFRTIADLEKDTGLSNKTIIKGLKKLNKHGFIKKWRGRKPGRKPGKETITFIRIPEITDTNNT